MALYTQRCCARSLLLRLLCPCVYALPTTRYALRVVPWPVLILVRTTTFLLPICFGTGAGIFDQLRLLQSVFLLNLFLRLF